MVWGAVAQEEVEVAALIGLQDAVFEQFCIAAVRGFAVWWGLLQGGEASLQFGVVDEEFDAAGFDVEQNLVAVLDDSERAADGGLGCDVEDDGAEGGAAHAGVGDAHHVFDALACELHGDWQIAGFGHAGCAFGTGVAEDEDVVGGDVEVGIVDAIGQVFDAVEDDGAAGVAHEVRRCGGVLDDGAEGREIAVEDRHRAFGFERRGEAADDVLMGTCSAAAMASPKVPPEMLGA